ncbi:tRNA pseudouridine(55) synthase TruB [Hathewaya histolytica]|uniref:tRNA pseudouridine synthase B n=1 Tax=Hathewaya histolytica TaxID=1498 RepID=A0A4U9RL02_HATHI|nr:tRNA pseudouridine(55) synthase TruB [Hathewaya histolytica]VTQ89520.1 tRNA pseudouridine synthase B [Hathewaya histolytica]
MNNVSGIIIIDKPKGITSFGVVNKLKKITGLKKIGHTGTLDPLATGVLPICIGKATKAVNYLIKDDKEYIAQIKLGETTDTYDKEGKIELIRPINSSVQDIIKVLNSFKGNILQTPPKYSALKLNGKKMYELARAGVEFEVKKREVEIYSLEIVDINLPFIEIKVNCSKGTYIRSLAYDIGENLGCGAHIYNLRRVSSGNFNLNSAIELQQIDLDTINKNIIPIENIFENFSKVELDTYFEKLFINGVPIKDKRLTSKIMENGLYRVYNINRLFLGLGNREKDYFKLESLF